MIIQWQWFSRKKCQTRLHSSRMHTARSLTITSSMLCSGGGCLVPGVPGQRDVWSRGAPAWSREGYLPGPGGGLVPGGWYPSMHWGRTPPVNRMTDRCKNITLPQTSFAGGNELMSRGDIYGEPWWCSFE